MRLKKYIIIPLIILILISLLLGACSSYRVFTDTYVDQENLPRGFPQGSTFALVSKRTDNTLFSKEVGHKIRTWLESKGYRVLEQDKADYLLTFDYDIDSFTETVHVQRTVPEREITRGEVQSRNGVTEYQEEKKSETTIYVPEEYTYYTRSLKVKVSDGQEDLWSGSSQSTGDSSDLREALDYLLVSVFHFFGKNTYRTIERSLDKDHVDVKSFRASF